MIFHKSAISIALAAPILTIIQVHGLPTCSPTWAPGSNYSTGSKVSQIITTSNTDSSGTTTTTSIVKNFICSSGTQPSLSHCPSYNPSNHVQQLAAWEDEGECNPSLPPSPVASGQTNASNQPKWTAKGCPKPWVADMDYAPGDLVQLEGMVYKCLDAGFSSFCGRSGFKPGDGDSMFWEQVWVLLGSCDGTISPSTSPNFISLEYAGGCPDEHQSGNDYGSGDTVSVRNIVYACKAWPYSQRCSMAGYEPDGPNAAEAWMVIGYCDGTIAPTSSPIYTVLTDHQGCPEEYSSSNNYEANSHVSVLAADNSNFLVYQCSSDVHKFRFCNQFVPNHWSQLGWIKVGFCDGSTIAPTSSPNFNHLTEIEGGCPEQFSTAVVYKAGDQVSVYSDTGSDQALVYKCKEHPYSAYCSVRLEVFAPYSENGDMGWTLFGYCAGTSSPTTSPVSYPDDKCRYYDGTAPVIIKEWSRADLSTYTGGTKVRVNEAIFKCKNYPYSGWCRSSAYRPLVSADWSAAWYRAGYCNGIFSPTVSPSTSPTSNPTVSPTSVPSSNPSKSPSEMPSPSGTGTPSLLPSESPSQFPSSAPSVIPSLKPSVSLKPSPVLSSSPSEFPSETPSQSPSSMPSEIPSSHPSEIPSIRSWTQVGQDIDGEAAGDLFGDSVSLSADGTILAIGAAFNDNENGNDSGRVRVFQLDGGSWNQIGQDIIGVAAGDRSGRSVSLSADGTVVAIGAEGNDGSNGSDSGHVRIFQFDGSSWTQVGQDIDGEAEFDLSGWNVSLSENGTVLAIGAKQNDGSGYVAGHVRVFQFDGSSWTQVGQDIDGEAEWNNFGMFVSLSADGTVLAIGAQYNDGSHGIHHDSGHVRLFELDGSSWTQVGQDIDGEAAGDRFGGPVTLSADGTVVAIGAPGNDGNGSDSGYVRVFQRDGDSWSKVGQDIDGEAAGDRFGWSVSLSENGTVLAIGANDSVSQSGSSSIRVFQLDGSSWTQVGLDIDGEAVGDRSGQNHWENFGQSVSLSADGTVLAIGAHGNDENGSNSGHVRVFSI